MPVTHTHKRTDRKVVYVYFYIIYIIHTYVYACTYINRKYGRDRARMGHAIPLCRPATPHWCGEVCARAHVPSRRKRYNAIRLSLSLRRFFTFFPSPFLSCFTILSPSVRRAQYLLCRTRLTPTSSAPENRQRSPNGLKGYNNNNNNANGYKV